MDTTWAAPLREEPPVLVTGAAGFIGFHLANRLLDAGLTVVGVDNLTPYYDPSLKAARRDALLARPRFRFAPIDLADRCAVAALFDQVAPSRVAHLAAQAGVRHSITNPHAYGSANLTAFLNVLEACRAGRVAHLVYASSSSVYGGNAKLPFSVHDIADHPVSLYAATKRANELMAHAYCHLYGFPATGLRFFTVYGPWGRPDMAYWLFADAIAEGRPITLFNDGDMRRDFTYVDDAVDSVARLLARAAASDPAFDPRAPDPATSWAPHRIYNVGATRPERLTDMVAILEEALGRKAEVRGARMPAGDVAATWADMVDLESVIGHGQRTALREGLQRFVTWWSAWRAGNPTA